MLGQYRLSSRPACGVSERIHVHRPVCRLTRKACHSAALNELVGLLRDDAEDDASCSPMVVTEEFEWVRTLSRPWTLVILTSTKGIHCNPYGRCVATTHNLGDVTFIAFHRPAWRSLTRGRMLTAPTHAASTYHVSMSRRRLVMLASLLRAPQPLPAFTHSLVCETSHFGLSRSVGETLGLCLGRLTWHIRGSTVIDGIWLILLDVINIYISMDQGLTPSKVRTPHLNVHIWLYFNQHVSGWPLAESQKCVTQANTVCSRGKNHNRPRTWPVVLIDISQSKD